MALVISVNTASILKEQFASCDRDCYEWETYEGLVEYFDGYGEYVELDVIAICCDLNEVSWSEAVDNYIDLKELINEYRNEEGLDDYPTYSEVSEEEKDIIRDYLSDNTSVIGYNSDYISFWAF